MMPGKCPNCGCPFPGGLCPACRNLRDVVQLRTGARIDDYPRYREINDRLIRHDWDSRLRR